MTAAWADVEIWSLPDSLGRVSYTVRWFAAEEGAFLFGQCFSGDPLADRGKLWGPMKGETR